MFEQASAVRFMAAAIVLSVAGLFGASPPVQAQGYRGLSCGQLWYERNAIYAQYGFCFKTEQAIRTFGRGCFPPYGRLPRDARSEVNEIAAWERRKGCTE